MVAQRSNDATQISPLMIITYPRTASNLLLRMLSLPEQQHTVSEESGGYFFLPATSHMRRARLLDRPPEAWTVDEVLALKEVFQSCCENLLALFNSANSLGKMAVVKEHAPFMMSPIAQSSFVHGLNNLDPLWRVTVPGICHSSASADLPLNESVLPDELLLRCTPAFLIRHPALAFPSYYRVMLSLRNGDRHKVEEMMNDLSETCTLRWTRNLYDWYIARWKTLGLEKSPPIILDADDIVRDKDLVPYFCDLVGLDSTKVRFHWDPVDGGDLAKDASVRQHTRATLLLSSGIMQGNTFHDLSIEGEVAKWRTQYGQVVADTLESWVKSAMPDYEYLLHRKLKCCSSQSK